MGMIIRLRTQLGTWRINDVDPHDTLFQLRKKVEAEKHADLLGNAFTTDAAGKKVLDDNLTIRQAGLENGSMLYITVSESGPVGHESKQKVITKDGEIISKPYEEVLSKDGFRPGMLSLRAMKMKWTLNEYVELDSKFVYKLKKQDETVAKKVLLDTKSFEEFQGYMRTLDYRRIRIGYLYGHVKPDNEVVVDFIYEPPQESTDMHFKLLDNEEEQAKVDTLAGYLGKQKVGLLVAHPPREDGFFFSGFEVLLAAEMQLESAGGLDNPDTTFTTIRMTLDSKQNELVTVEGYQVSKQCMEMAAEGVLAPSTNLSKCMVDSTFTVEVEGKPSKEVDNAFFLALVPIGQHDTPLLLSRFPRANRDGLMMLQKPSVEALKQQILSAGKGGWTLIDMLSDFQLLLFLSNFLDLNSDMSTICQCVTHRDIPLDEGYKLIIRGIAGIEM